MVTDNGVAYAVDTATGEDVWAHRIGGVFVGSPIVANGVLYHARSAGLHARDPTTGNQLFLDSSIGSIHWESPIVVDGKVYVTDESARLWAYGSTLTNLPAIELLLLLDQ